MHHRSSRSRCREEPQGAARLGFGGNGASLSPVRAEGNFWIPQWLNSSRVASDSAHKIGFSAGENYFAHKMRQNSSKKSSGIPVRELLDEELSRTKERIRYSPSIVAKLMGLDTPPNSVRKQKPLDQTAASTDIWVSYPEDLSHRSINEDQLFKDVFEVRETSEVKNNKDMKMLDGGVNETEVGISGPEHTSMKLLPTHEVHQNARRPNNALVEIPDSSNGIFLELFRDPNSFYAKRLQDLNNAPSSPHRSKITILKPGIGAKNWSSEGWPQSSKSERNHDRCFDRQEVRVPVKMHAGSLNQLFVKEKSDSIPLNSSASQLCHLEGPAQIVILKPNREKAQKMAVNNLITDDDSWDSSKKCLVLGDPGIEELQVEATQKLSYYVEGSSNKSSAEIAREITRKTRNVRRRRNKNIFSSEMKLYDLSSDNFGVLSNSFNPSSPPYKTESSVNMEARKRLSERWKITCQLQNNRRTYGGSSTLGELLALSDRDTLEVTMDAPNTKKYTDEKFAHNRVLGRKGCSLGVKGQDNFEDVSSRFFPMSTSPPIFSDYIRSHLHIKDVQNKGSSASSDAKFCKTESLPVQSSNSQLAYFVEEENMLPEREIHINSEGMRKKTDASYLNKITIDPLHTDSVDRDMNQPKNSASNSTVGDESWYLTGLGKIKEISSEHPQVEMLPSEPNMAESHNLSFEELEQSSPISVLETPSEDEAYISGCFERLTSDLKELRAQLQLLKLESMDTYTEEIEAPWSKEDCARDNHGSFPSREVYERFKDDDDRDYSYLLDMLVESGFHETDNKKLFDACFLLDYPFGQNVFDQLEKKYGRFASWPRSERRLLFDLINCTLSALVATSMDHSGEKSKTCQQAWDREGPLEVAWQMVVKQRNEPDRDRISKLVDQEWVGFEHGVDVITRGIERMLSDDLMEELFAEFA